MSNTLSDLEGVVGGQPVGAPDFPSSSLTNQTSYCSLVGEALSQLSRVSLASMDALANSARISYVSIESAIFSSRVSSIQSELLSRAISVSILISDSLSMNYKVSILLADTLSQLAYTDNAASDTLSQFALTGKALSDITANTISETSFDSLGLEWTTKSTSTDTIAADSLHSVDFYALGPIDYVAPVTSTIVAVVNVRRGRRVAMVSPSRIYY